jgi:hypothetical protein
MMPWLAGGILGVIVLALAMNGLANASPARMARLARWLGLGALLALGVVFLTRRIYMLGFLSWGAAFLLWRGMKNAPVFSGAHPGGRTSDVETEWVRMSLDLDSGATMGVVLQGAYAGRTLESLSLTELRAVLAEARLNDADAARLIEAFIARTHPDAEPEAASDAESARPMSRDEAYDVLGLKPGANSGQIREAHRRLMQQMHPDKGGSDYLAAKINEARDLLLKDATA